MGVPIKKRKFPFIRPSSPPQQTVTEPVEQSKLMPESSSSTAVIPTKIFTSASPISTSSKEENRQHSPVASVKFEQSNVLPPAFSPQDPTTEIASGSGSELCSKSTLIVSNDTVFPKIVGCSELQLAPNKALVQKKEEDMRNGREASKNSEPNLLETSVKGEPLLAPNLAVQGSEGIHEEEKLDPCLWNLALTERQSSSRGGHSSDPEINCSRLQTNRTHWDLNTMMDTWEGSMNPTVGHEAGLDGKHHMHSNLKMLSESERSLVVSGKKTLEKSDDKSKLSSMSAPPDQQTRNDILLHLSLSTSAPVQSSFRAEPSLASSSTKVDSTSDLSNNLKLSKNVLSAPCNLNLAGSRIVKSEPSDESNKQDFQGVKASHLKLVKGRIVKTEPCVGYFQEHHITSNIGNLKMITHGSVKSEPVGGVNQKTLGMSKEKSRKSEVNTCNAALPLSGQSLPVPEVPNCTMPLPITLHSLPCSTSLGLSNSAEAPSQFKIPSNTIAMPSTGEEAPETIQIGGAFASDSDSKSVCTDGEKVEAAGDLSSIPGKEGVDVVGTKSSRLKSMDKLQSDSHGNSDVAGSDDEKINIFDDMQDDCSSDTDDESDGNHGTGVVMDPEDKLPGGEEDDYEDGEVREPLVHCTTEVGVGPDEGFEYSYRGIADNREASVSGYPANANVINAAHVEDKCIRLEDTGTTKSSHDEHDNCASGPPCLQEASLVDMPTVGTGKVEPMRAAHRGLLNSTRREDILIGCQKDLLSDGTVSTSQGISPGDDQGSTVSQQENVERNKPDETKFSVWTKTESLVVGAEAGRDVNGKGNQSRIINLSRAFSGPSPGRMRSFPGRFVSSRIERERFNDGLRNGDKLHPRGNRDDGSIDGRNKFERQRNQDQPVGSPGSDFMHGRGRPDKRFDSPHAAVMVARDGTVVGAGRKQLTDELPHFRHPPRRRSPGGRGRPVSHGVQIVRRSARDISPDRCIVRGDPNLIGLRPEKKFMRGLPDDMMDTVFSRSQTQYQQVDDHFVRGERSFSPIQRKGPLHIPRIRSRSPSRTRSPGPWTSPRRRSPDGFGRPELLHRRSPPFYRVKRIRSPHQRPVFADDIEGRRQGSPPYISRISNDIREPDHPRSFIPNRSPSGRVLPRSSRRFDMVDPRERIDNDEYFTGPIHSDRFHEIGGDGSAEGRRICAERRRSFRPTYEAAEVEKFHFHVEGGPRPYRFSPEADAEFHERGNLRDREFERRVKNRTGNAPRRTRSVEEHEENYRHGEQGWHGTNFEDVSPPKRRRF